MILTFGENLTLIFFNQDRYLNSFRWSSVFIFWFALAFPSSSFAIYIQLDGIADVKTNFSDGCASIKDIGNQSERLGIDAVIFGDLARNSFEFGAKPFERIFKNTTEKPSVNRQTFDSCTVCTFFEKTALSGSPDFYEKVNCCPRRARLSL